MGRHENMVETHEQFVEQALARYEGPLIGYALGIVHDLDRARDVVQDTFIRLYQQDREKVQRGLLPLGPREMLGTRVMVALIIIMLKHGPVLLAHWLQRIYQDLSLQNMSHVFCLMFMTIPPMRLKFVP